MENGEFRPPKSGKALLITKINGNDDNGGGFVVDFNEEGKVEMINLTMPAFF